MVEVFLPIRGENQARKVSKDSLAGFVVDINKAANSSATMVYHKMYIMEKAICLAQGFKELYITVSSGVQH